MSTPAQPPGSTGIEITAKFFVLAFILNFFKPIFTIDGVASKQNWRTPTFMPTTPGQHQVQVHFPYLLMKTCGKANTTVTVADGQVVKLGYKAPWLLFLAGKLKPVA
jgi:hypothetical protein